MRRHRRGMRHNKRAPHVDATKRQHKRALQKGTTVQEGIIKGTTRGNYKKAPQESTISGHHKKHKRVFKKLPQKVITRKHCAIPHYKKAP